MNLIAMRSQCIGVNPRVGVARSHLLESHRNKGTLRLYERVIIIKEGALEECVQQAKKRSRYERNLD